MARQKKTETQKPTVMTAATDQQYFRITEAAEYLRCKPWAIGEAIRQEKLPKIQIGKTFVLMRADLDTFAVSLRDAA